MDLPALTPQEARIKRLRRFNGWMAVFHAAQGLVMLFTSNDFSLPVTSAFIKFDPLKGQLAPMLKTVLELRIGPLVAGFLLMSAFAHFCLAYVRPFRARYESNLEKGINSARWIEYMFSSSLMIVVIALLAGMYDGVSLLLIFFLNMMMILFGWLMELHNQSTAKTDWTAYIFGCVAGIVPWIAIAIFLFNAGEGAYRPPTFVYWIFFSMFLFFNVFAVNMYLQYKKSGKWVDYLFGERVYVILSLVAKSLLAWQVYAATLRPV